MDYRLIAPPVPSLARWRRMAAANPGQSLLRMLTNEHLGQIEMRGQVLDFGGGQRAKYLTLLPKGIDVASVNIDAGIQPTHLIEPGQPLPFPDESFDDILCLNTLEHIYDPLAAMQDMYRVLKPGGRLHVMVPFMFRINGHPDDYLRATPSWWRESFRRCGFSALELTPLVWGRASTASLVPGFRGVLPRLRLHLAMLRDILTARLTLRGPRMTGRRAERIFNTAPGWFMTGRKGMADAA